MSDKPETLEGIWKDDLLERRKDAERIIRFVTAEVRERKATEQVASYVLNVDSAWGQGKTFFLKRLQDHLQFEGHKVALINAWEDDHGEDPLIPFVIELDKLLDDSGQEIGAATQTGIRLGKLGSQIARHVFRGYIKQKIGESAFEGIARDLMDASLEEADKALNKTVEGLFASFEETKKSSAAFRKQLKQLAGKETKPVFVLIDELDRCRPTYAILLLERIKHFFEADNVVFIVATDTEQLGHSIKAVYGNDFDSRAYLRRFFMRTYVFPEPSLNQFIESFFSRKSEDFKKKLSSPPDNDHADFIAAWAEASDLSLRDLEQCFDILTAFANEWDKPVPIELIYAMPLIIAHQRNDTKIFKALVDKKGIGYVEELFSTEYPLRKLRAGYLESGEIFLDIRNFLDQFLVLSAQDLPTSMKREDANDQWIANRLRHEFNIIHNNTFNPLLRPSSVCNLYSDYIIGAARFRAEGLSEALVPRHIKPAVRKPSLLADVPKNFLDQA